jgi:hypothetical protein
MLPESRELLRDQLANWERFPRSAQEIDPLIRLDVME